MIERFIGLAAACLVCGFSLGCGTTDFPNDVPANTADVDEIVSDTDLMGQEKRDQLAALGFSQTTINSLLRDDTTANEFGGDLTSAFNKITGGQLNQLTPDEVQLYVGAVEDAGGPSVNMPDDGAQASVDYFVLNGVTTRAELETALANPAIDVPGVIPTGALPDVFVDFDPNEVISQLP